MKESLKAVIFDMDGLLIDSEPLWEEAEIKILTEVGVPLTRERTKETMGLRIDEVVEYWFSQYPQKEGSKKEIEEKIVKEVIRLVKEKGVPQKGAKEIVELLAKERIPMAIASSSLIEIITAVLEKLSIERHIKVVHSAEHEPFGKPHPGVYIGAAQKLKVVPESCLAFEDSPNGLLAAKAAKMTCIVVPYEKVKDDRRFCIADLIVDSLADPKLFDYLGLSKEVAVE